jgi:hypothetical protein
MSVYQLNKLCHRLLRDLDFRSAMQKDPAAAAAPYDLSAAERKALLAGDVATMFEMGVHPFLLSFLTRYEIAGLTTPVYSERIRAARDPRGGSAGATAPDALEHR